jgi:hypothetical protein
LKRGRLDTGRLTRKYGTDPLVEWAEQWRSLEAGGHVERLVPTPVLSRRGLLEVDGLLPRFFDPACREPDAPGVRG